MKLITIVGARPQFIKAAAVSRCFKSHFPAIQEEIIHTGQHYDYGMSQVFFDEMQIPMPTINLHVGSGTHGAATGEMLKAIERELLNRKPDYVLVYGDTNSTLAGALAASKLHIPVAHVEAGERSYNRQMPEEVNRILTDHLSAKLFCCSDKAKNRLATEGITENVLTVGDVMYDVFLNYQPKWAWPKGIEKLSDFVLVTLHRAQNTDEVDRLKTIFSTLSDLPQSIIFPIHPRTQKLLNSYQIPMGKNIHLIEPVSYFEMLGLLQACSYVMTDSGGLQKEAYYAGKKCIVLREETEWTELVEIGVNCVTGIQQDKIMNAANWAKQAFNAPNDIYGDGTASHKIAMALDV